MPPGLRAAWTAWAIAATTLGVPGLFYVLAAEAWATRLVIGAVLGLLAGSAAWLRGRRGMGAVIAAVGVVSGIGALARTPDGRGTGAARSIYTDAAPYPRYAVSNVIPEIDQMKFGSYLAPALDPIITLRSAAKLRALTTDVYRAMDADPRFYPLGSAMSYAYSDLSSGHLYTYVPEHAAAERLGALVFLHGSAGNFKVYTHLLTRVADLSWTCSKRNARALESANG
jgi:hypothetical protein